MRLLTPHFRRAVAIGDLLDMRRLEMAALAQTLDGLAVGVGIAAADGALLHANAAAQAMLASGGPLRLDGGRLAASRAEGTAELRAAIAATEGPGMGPAGIGVALNAPANPPAVAHVLPLIASGPRRRPEPRAAAAVFVREAARSAPPGVEAVAAAFGLTPAEARLLERLVAGAMLAEAAAGLGIAATTAKTQLAQIFAKAGVSRQAELLALVERLVPPVRQP
jgi:DNA-binding CsgD family transcriptional regulator